MTIFSGAFRICSHSLSCWLTDCPRNRRQNNLSDSLKTYSKRHYHSWEVYRICFCPFFGCSHRIDNFDWHITLTRNHYRYNISFSRFRNISQTPCSSCAEFVFFNYCFSWTCNVYDNRKFDDWALRVCDARLRNR